MVWAGFRFRKEKLPPPPEDWKGRRAELVTIPCPHADITLLGLLDPFHAWCVRKRYRYEEILNQDIGLPPNCKYGSFQGGHLFFSELLDRFYLCYAMTDWDHSESWPIRADDHPGWSCDDEWVSFVRVPTERTIIGRLLDRVWGDTDPHSTIGYIYQVGMKWLGSNEKGYYRRRPYVDHMEGAGLSHLIYPFLWFLFESRGPVDRAWMQNAYEENGAGLNMLFMYLYWHSRVDNRKALEVWSRGEDRIGRIVELLTQVHGLMFLRVWWPGVELVYPFVFVCKTGKEDDIIGCLRPILETWESGPKILDNQE